MSTTFLITVLVVVGVVLVLAGAAVLMSRIRRSQHLRAQFGPEYERVLAESGSRREAERALEQRWERHEQHDIRPLRPDERHYYRSSWQQVQRDFVDDPGQAVRNADRLVVVIMRERGYPVDDFEQRAADISVAHPQVVEHYRQARLIADSHQAGRASTEDLRNAVTSYRSLVDALLDDGGTDRPGDRPPDTGQEHHSPDGRVREPDQDGDRT
ncbi:MAG TPA: hypothetical protein VGI84_06220 [Pseudonocardiaceae bacterium]